MVYSSTPVFDDFFPNLFLLGTAASFSSARIDRSGGECCQVIRQFLTAARGGNQRRAKPGRRLFMQRRVLCSAAFLLQNRDVNFFSQCFGIVMQRGKSDILRMVFNS